MATASTCLNLLMRDGAISVTFTPALEVTQYEELLEEVRDAELIDELQALVYTLGDRWGRSVIVA